MTRNKRRRAKRVIRIYKQINIRKEVIMSSEEKKKFPWMELVKAVVMAVIGVLTGTQL